MNLRGSSPSLRRQIVAWTGALVALVFILVIGLNSHNLQSQLQASIYQGLATRNAGYVHTISAIFEARSNAILALRDDLELYDTRGQMWVHLTAHVGVQPGRSRRAGLSMSDALERPRIDGTAWG